MQLGEIVDVEGTGGYMSHTSHSSFHNQVYCCRLLTTTLSSRHLEGNSMKNRRVISELIMVDVYLGLNRPANAPLTVQETLLVVMVNLDIGTTPSTITPKEEIVEVMVL